MKGKSCLVSAVLLIHAELDLMIFSSAITPNGLAVFRSRIYGGISAEVLTIFNKSCLAQKLRGQYFLLLDVPADFLVLTFTDFGLVPPNGPAPGTKMGVADSAYARSTISDDVPLYLPVPLPDDNSNPRVRKCC